MMISSLNIYKIKYYYDKKISNFVNENFKLHLFLCTTKNTFPKEPVPKTFKTVKSSNEILD